MVSLDTNILIEAARIPSIQNQGIVYGALNVIRGLIERQEDLIIPIPVMFEFLCSQDRLLRDTILKSFMDYGAVAPMDERSAILAANVHSVLRDSGYNIPRLENISRSDSQEIVKVDMMIAAISVVEGATAIYTRNVRDFEPISSALSTLGYSLLVMDIQECSEPVQGNLFRMFHPDIPQNENG